MIFRYGVALAWLFLCLGAMPFDNARAQQPVQIPDDIQKKIKELNDDYRALAEASCGLRQTDIPPMQEVMSLEMAIKSWIRHQAAYSPEFSAALKTYGGKAETKKEAQENKAARDKAFDAIHDRIIEQIDKLIVRNPKVACPAPGRTVQPLQPAGCQTCAGLDAEIKRLDADYKALDGKSGDAVIAQRHQIDAQITKLQGEKTSCEKLCKAPPRTAKKKKTEGQYYQKEVPPLRTLTPPRRAKNPPGVPSRPIAPPDRERNQSG